ncbi:hypothetical protein PILCRDRAFT_89185 [Piloderma croceum F 1598]|uniref:Uncharacterized protein n=1 Tax=Piloderma croceum (strain F 1598) TaxID=765440 RepID=A0A0C3BV17_PILCF|nr:hypothetical protein PILCRDRAFT_89185 [Piloderma croceum F 1598]
MTGSISDEMVSKESRKEVFDASQTLQACYCVSKCKKKALGYDMVLSRTARRHREADRQVSLSTVVSVISPALPSLARHETLPISISNQVIPPLELPLVGLALQSIENDFSDADYGQPSSDNYEFGYPQDLYPPLDSLTYMDLDDILSNDGSQGVDNRAGQIESRPEIPDNALPHEEYSRSQSPGNSPPPSPSLDGSSSSATDETEEVELAMAFRENPTIRLLYLQTVVANIFDSRTVLACNTQLTDGLDLLDAAGISLIQSIKPATTLATAKRRLGLEYDDYIEKRPICTICSKYYTLNDINSLHSPSCTKPRCKGIAYRIKRSTDDPPVKKRVPAKILPYMSLIQSLQRMLLRPSFVNNLVPFQESEFDKTTRMYDIQDSPAYNSLEIRLKRVVDEDGNVRDIEASPGSRRLLTSCDLGLGMTLNLDWFGITDRRPHSAGGAYIIFNQLHRSVRLLEHNIHLSMVMSGEPSKEDLNNCIDPLKDELKQLYSGLIMKVYERRLPQMVHAAVLLDASDVPASQKLQGAAVSVT